MAKILVLNGPNLNLLGSREPAVYGRTSLEEIVACLTRRAAEQDVGVAAFQSNDEAALIDRIHSAKAEGVDAILFNPGALTHTSVALRDALLAVALPFIEVHLSNVYARESFRHRSYLSDIAVGVIVGLGPLSYELGLEALMRRLARP